MSMMIRAQRLMRLASEPERLLALARERYLWPFMAKRADSWTLLAASPPREVFAVMEQMLGTPPFRFELTGESSARILEFRRMGPFGEWSKRASELRTRWVTCEARPSDAGTVVTVVASRGRGAVPRALQLVQLLSRGAADQRTVYRRRAIPAGPVSLVASWAGIPYRLFSEPRRDAPRGPSIHTASRLEAIPGGAGPFTKVRLDGGGEGFAETDQIVAAPEASTRDAQVQAARFG